MCILACLSEQKVVELRLESDALRQPLVFSGALYVLRVLDLQNSLVHFESV